MTDCLVDYFIDTQSDQPQAQKFDNAYVENPRSVHFAFRNAGITLVEIFKSEWADCHKFLAHIHELRLKLCREGTQLEDNEESEVDALITCVTKARKARIANIERCNKLLGAKLPERLQEELKIVRDRWSLLSKRFFELEKAHGTYGAIFPAAARRE